LSSGRDLARFAQIHGDIVSLIANALTGNHAYPRKS
jgi:hypothetical protein